MNKKVLQLITILTLLISTLLANNININANNANFQGVSLRADNTLNIESLRNTASLNNKGFSVNAGMEFGSGSVQSVNGGASTSNLFFPSSPHSSYRCEDYAGDGKVQCGYRP